MIILLVLAAVIVGAPIIAALLVSIASRREDAERTLGGRAPGKIAAAARWLLRTGSPRAQVPRVPQPRSPGRDEPTRPLPRPRA